MNIFVLILVFSAFLSILIPLMFISMREAVKQQRQEIVRDLQTIFAIPGNTSSNEIIPSFEFLKYKYFFERGSNDQLNGTTPKDFTYFQWFMGTLPIIIMGSIFNAYCFILLAHYGFHLSIPQIDSLFPYSNDIPLLSLVVLASYAGAALFMIKAFSGRSEIST